MQQDPLPKLALNYKPTGYRIVGRPTTGWFQNRQCSLIREVKIMMMMTINGCHSCGYHGDLVTYLFNLFIY